MRRWCACARGDVTCLPCLALPCSHGTPSHLLGPSASHLFCFSGSGTASGLCRHSSSLALSREESFAQVYSTWPLISSITHRSQAKTSPSSQGLPFLPLPMPLPPDEPLSPLLGFTSERERERGEHKRRLYFASCRTREGHTLLQPRPLVLTRPEPTAHKGYKLLSRRSLNSTKKADHPSAVGSSSPSTRVHLPDAHLPKSLA